MSDRPAIPFEEVLDRLPEPDRTDSKRLYAESLAYYQGLRELREAMNKTQAEIAGRMGITTAAVSKLERKADIYVGTLRRAVEAMGGQLEVTVRLPDREPIRLGVPGDPAVRVVATDLVAESDTDL